jgi:hypothetical protein
MDLDYNYKVEERAGVRERNLRHNHALRIHVPFPGFGVGLGRLGLVS